VLAILSEESMRFNAVRRTMVGVSHRMLTLTLRGWSEAHGPTRSLLASAVRTDGTRRVADRPALRSSGWSGRNRPAIMTARARFDAKRPRQTSDAPRPRSTSMKGRTRWRIGAVTIRSAIGRLVVRFASVPSPASAFVAERNCSAQSEITDFDPDAYFDLEYDWVLEVL
jgi:hypothetical protein